MPNQGDPTQYIRNGIVTRGENETGISIYDPKNPRSVYSLVPNDVKIGIESVNPEFYRYTEKALLNALERHDKLDERDYRLRIAFWAEYNRVQDNFLEKMSIANITRGCCSKRYFYDAVLKDPHKLAWILFPVTEYKLAMEEMLDFGLREMRKILKLPLHKKKQVPRRGRGPDKDKMYYEEVEEVDIAAIREKIKVFALLDNRVKGAVTQSVRIEQKTQNLHQHQFAPQRDHTKNLEAPKSLNQIEAEIKSLKREPMAHINGSSIETTAKEEDGPGDDEKA